LLCLPVTWQNPRERVARCFRDGPVQDRCRADRDVGDDRRSREHAAAEVGQRSQRAPSRLAAGYLCGSLGQRSAEAQLGDVMKKAGAQGGAFGSVGQLGSSIVEMQQHVDGLNKDLETLRKVKTALGG